jgi:hypothetical protein
MTLAGVDVSSYQGTPGQWHSEAGSFDWAAVKLTEFQPDGTRFTDPQAEADWAGLKADGKGRIAYLFGHPATSVSQTVDLFLSELDRLGVDDADGVALDHEENDGVAADRAAGWGVRVLDRLHSELGRKPLLYTFLDFAHNGYCAGMGQFPLWISDPSSPAGQPEVPAPWKTWAIHQWSITGVIDRDIASYASLTAMAAAIGKPKPAAPVHETPAPTWQERAVKALPEVKQGSKGAPVRTVQGLCYARGHQVTVDGNFGPATEAAVCAVQSDAKVKVDGIVGSATWPVLLGVS